MKTFEKFISSIISEAELDHRIMDGVVDLKKSEHIQVVAEKMYDSGVGEEIVNEFVEKFLMEGKHPERQAYNKDGWLVTFPSKEYRDAAIKKGTHAVSDPTHGKGGMNLYYKKRGKQKRQTQQATTADVGAEKPEAPSQQGQQQVSPKAEPQAAQQQKKRPTAGRIVSPAYEPEEPSKETGSVEDPAKSEEPKSQEPKTQEPTTKAPEKDQSQAKPAEQPVQAPQKEPTISYADISKKFAESKGWTSTPYGEYRDLSGETQAVIGLSGEIVPVKSVDRDEYKIFAKKSSG